MTREGDRKRRDEVLDGDVDGDDSVSRLPSFVSACAAEWQAAMPPRTLATNITGMGSRRCAALLAGTSVPRRSEVHVLDEALKTDALRFLPRLCSASITVQRMPEPSAEKRVVAEEHISAWLRKRRATKAAAQKKKPVELFTKV